MEQGEIKLTTEELYKRFLRAEISIEMQKGLILFLIEQKFGIDSKPFSDKYDLMLEEIYQRYITNLQIKTGVFGKEAEDLLKSLKDDLGI